MTGTEIQRETATCICSRPIHRDTESQGAWIHDDTDVTWCNKPGFSSTYAMPSTPAERERWASFDPMHWDTI